MIWFWEKQRSPVGWWQKLILGLAGLLAVLWTDRKCQPPHLPVWHPSLLPCLFTTSISGQLGQSYGFSSGHVWMWELDHKESWAPKYWCLCTGCWRRLLRVFWTAKRSNQSILKKISPEYSLEELMLKLKLQYFWPPDEKNWLIWKDPDAGKDWRWEEKGMKEDEMAGWNHWLNEHEFE